MKLLIFTDGASRGNPGKAAISFLIYSGKNLLDKGAKPIGIATNNEAEYTAAISALGLAARKHHRSKVILHSDSALLVNQLNNEWKVKEKRLKELHSRAKSLEEGFSSVKYVHVRRSHPIIRRADLMANQVLDAAK
jgi:ribonuclease HI